MGSGLPHPGTDAAVGGGCVSIRPTPGRSCCCCCWWGLLLLLLLLLLLSTLPACLPVVVCVGGRRAALVHHRARRCEPCEEGRPIGLAACVRAARWPSPPPSAAFVIVCECWLHSWAESPNPRSKAPMDTREPLKKARGSVVGSGAAATGQTAGAVAKPRKAAHFPSPLGKEGCRSSP